MPRAWTHGLAAGRRQSAVVLLFASAGHDPSGALRMWKSIRWSA